MFKRIELEPTVPEICLNVEEIYSTYAYFYSPKFQFTGETHEAWELIYANSGEAVIETPDYKTVLAKGQVFLHVPNEPHKIKANNMSCNMFFISFKCGCKRLYEIGQKPIAVSSSLKNYIIAVVEEGLIYLAGKNNIPGRETPPEYASGQLIKNYTELLLIELIRRNARTALQNAPKTSTLTEKSVVEQIVAYMEENVHVKLKLEQIALWVGYSIPRICSIFKKTTGMSIITYFTKLRIQTAKRLMAEKAMSIRQISEYLDYDSVQYFSAQFKKVTGLPPSQYVAYLKSKNFQYDDAENLLFLK